MFIFPVPRSRKLYCEWRDHRGHVHRWAGHEEKTLTEALGEKLEKLAGYASHRIEPPPELVTWVRDLPPKRRQRLSELGMLIDCRVSVGSLDEYQKAFAKHLERGERSHEHRRHQVARVKRALEEIDVTRLDTLHPEAVSDWLYTKRRQLDPWSIATANHYVVALKSFTRWLTITGKLATDPLRNLRRLPAGEVTVKRRALDDDEIRKLLTHVEGTDRYWVYRLAVETGLRKGELSHLRASDFDLKRRIVTVQAAYAKARRVRIVPLRAATAKALGGLIAPLAPDAHALAISKRAGELLREDLKACGVSTVDMDFHALRHTAATRLGYSVESFPDLMALLGHTTPGMSARYFHSDLARMRRAVEGPESVSVDGSVNLGSKRTNGKKPKQTKNAPTLQVKPAKPRTYRKSG